MKRAGIAHLPALARFFALVWDADSTPEKVARAWESGASSNPVDPGKVPPAFVFLRGDEVLGYLSTIPARFRYDGRNRNGYWLKGLWVLPEHRGGPVGFHLVRAACQELSTLASLAVAAPARRLFEAVGFQDVAQPPNYVWPLRPGRLAMTLDPDRVLGTGSRRVKRLWKLARLTRAAIPAGALAGLLLRGRRRVSIGVGDHDISTSWDEFADPEVDRLWGDLADMGAQGLVRDAQYLRWRYKAGGRQDYHLILVSRGGRLLAIAVVRRPDLQADGPLADLHVSWVSELIFDPREDASRRAACIALRKAEKEAHRAGADILASSFAGPQYAEVLRLAGHFRRPASMHLLIRGFEGDADKTSRAETGPGEPAEGPWIVARGDGNSDGA